MENSNTESIFNLTLSQKLKDDFKTASTWASITAIVAFINAAVTLFVNVSQGALFSAFLTAAISVLINIFLLNFGRKMKAGITDDNQEQINDSLNDLRLYFKITGILIIVVLVIVLLSLIVLGFAYGTK